MVPGREVNRLPPRAMRRPFSGCGWFGAKEKRVRKGTTVKVHYTVSAGGLSSTPP